MVGLAWPEKNSEAGANQKAHEKKLGKKCAPLSADAYVACLLQWRESRRQAAFMRQALDRFSDSQTLSPLTTRATRVDELYGSKLSPTAALGTASVDVASGCRPRRDGAIRVEDSSPVD